MRGRGWINWRVSKHNNNTYARTQRRKKGPHLGLALAVEGDVGHLLAGVKERVLGALGQDVLRRAHKHGQHERRGAELGRDGREDGGEEREGEEHGPRDEEGNGRDHGSHAPAEFLEVKRRVSSWN